MDSCCKNKTTPFCDECGANLEGKSLAGLKAHLKSKLESARNRLGKWINSTGDTIKKEQGIARNMDIIVQLESWIMQLEKIIPHVPATT